MIKCSVKCLSDCAMAMLPGFAVLAAAIFFGELHFLSLLAEQNVVQRSLRILKFLLLHYHLFCLVLSGLELHFPISFVNVVKNATKKMSVTIMCTI